MLIRTAEIVSLRRMNVLRVISQHRVMGGAVACALPQYLVRQHNKIALLSAANKARGERCAACAKQTLLPRALRAP